ncbi:MAG: mucoidy inhibitor MuiA family protein [Rhodospirillales bacterium]|nr:mucoidy inhibitor MuiA family protein [Rhodospirillales bacterium]
MGTRFWIFLGSALVFLAPALAGAAVVETGGKIEAVTVFTDRAEVTRTLRVSLPAGESTVQVPGLPAGLIEQSLRVRGLGDGDFLIGSVRSKKQFAEQVVQDKERRLNEEIEALQDRRRALVDRIAAFKVQLDFIAKIGKEAPRTAHEELIRGEMKPEAWQKAWALLGSGAAEALEGIRLAEVEQRDLDAKIERKQRELSQVRTGQRATVTASVNLEADEPGELRLALSYQLPGASWQPLYDARLDSEAGTVGLTQYGQVRQRSGEDWRGVTLTLSTARPAVSARMPDLGTWFVDFIQVYPVGGEGFGDAEGVSGLVREDALEAPARKAEAEAPEDAAEESRLQVAELRSAEFAAEYVIPGLAEVPSDNAPHKFAIRETTLEAGLAVRVVPKVAAQGYITAEVEHPGEDPLLPGAVNVFRDGAFVGTGDLPLLRPGEAHRLSFGVDEKVRVDYRLVEGERSREGLIKKARRSERRYRTEIANHHARPIEITVLDNLPVPRDERIKVELLDDSTPPSETDFEERKGVLAWTSSYAPAEKREILFGYAVTYPEGESLPGF